jgi:two-component system, response regulator PdtaR
MNTSPASGAANLLLIVEDDLLLAAEMEEALKQAGFQVLPPAHDAEQAMQLARTHRPQIALVDIELLGCQSGIELASQLRNELNIRSIFVSGHSDPATVAASSRAEPISWLKKPFAVGSVVASVQLALHGPRQDARS